MNLSPTLARIAWAVLYGLIVFIVCLIIGAVLNAVGLPSIGAIMTRFAAILGILAGIVAFLTGHRAV